MKDSHTIIVELKQVQLQMQDYLQKYWRIFVIEGVFFILLGISAIVIPQLFSVAIIMALGWIIILTGTVQVSRTLYFREMPDFGLWLFLGILQLFVGYLFVAEPIAGVLTVTAVMIFFFAFEGMIKVLLAFLLRPLAHWKYVLFSGVTALIFALLILVNWSEVEHWLLGLFLGVNMIMLGFSMVKMGLSYKPNT